MGFGVVADVEGFGGYVVGLGGMDEALDVGEDGALFVIEMFFDFVFVACKEVPQHVAIALIDFGGHAVDEAAEVGQMAEVILV